MPNISDNITRQNVLDAVKKIEREKLMGSSQKYEVIIDGKRFPPPLICQYADYFANGQQRLLETNTFPVGKDTKCFKMLEKLRFEIVDKSNKVIESFSEILNIFLEDAKDGNLKTKHYPKTFSDLKMKVSFGQGALAKVPWIAFTRDNQEVQSGIYPVFLFYKEFNCLILAYGVSQNNTPKSQWPAIDALKINTFLNAEFGANPDQYTDSFVFATYDTSSKIDDLKINNDLNNLINFYKSLDLDSDASQKTEKILNIETHTLSKPFILLAGISGTGKSRFVRKQAEAWQGIENFELVAVRPDWHEPSDLLGYTLRIKDTPEFVSTAVLKFMVKAWLATINSGTTLGETDQKIIATYSPETPPPPFWLCLDEMNLAPVEQYFADYLSIIETREWSDNQYRCEPILKAETIQECQNMQKALGLDSEDYAAKTLWAHIQKHGLAIPFNLIVAGTVNMDETTHGFSRKVIDRALSLDFGEFAPNNFADFFKPESEKPQFKTLSYPTISQATANDENAQKTIEFLQAVNQVLEGTLFEIAYRALNECLLEVECEQPAGETRLKAVWDDFLMMKILPRIEGDEDKLASPNTDDDTLLTALEKVLETQLSEIWTSTRPDLLRDNAPEIACRSKAKIARMKALLANGFTSFWP